MSKHRSAEEKLSIVREYLLLRKPISQVAAKHGVHPNSLRIWARALLFGGSFALERYEKMASRKNREEKAKSILSGYRKQREAIETLLRENVQMKMRIWGKLSGGGVAQFTKDAVVDYVEEYSRLTEISTTEILDWMGVSRSTFYSWREKHCSE